MSTPHLKVGFDFDGVIVYNPLRIIRPIVTYMKKRGILFKRKQLEFFEPKTKTQEVLWKILHQSSIFPADGVDTIRKLVNNGNIQAYIITGRFKSLEKDFFRWMQRIHAGKTFTKWYLNARNEQPHLFKERMIRRLDLDVFIEDNWDIVQYLRDVFEKEARARKRKILWISNILDWNIEYRHKFSSLSKALSQLTHTTKTKLPERVLVVSDYFFPHWTGLSKSLFYYCSALSNDIQIRVLTVKTSPELASHEYIDGVEVYRTPPLFRLSRAWYSIHLFWKFLQLLPSAQVVFINSPCTNIFLCSLITKLSGKKLVIFHQGDLILPPSLPNSLIQTIFSLSTKVSFSLADKLSSYTREYAYHSYVLKEFIQKFQASILPIPVPPEQSKKVLHSNNIRFGFAGRFVHEKGFDILFRAIPEIIQNFPEAKFYFAGQTQMGYENFFAKNEGLLKLVQKHIVFEGLLEEKQLAKFYRSLHFFILPSRSECFGLVQAEAMLYGTPVICSNVPGASVLVSKTKFGVLFESENPHDLAQKIISAVGHYDKIMKNQTRAQAFLKYQKLVQSGKKLLQF